MDLKTDLRLVPSRAECLQGERKMERISSLSSEAQAMRDPFSDAPLIVAQRTFSPLAREHSAARPGKRCKP